MQPVQVNIPINHYHSSIIKKQDGLILLLQILKTKLAKTAYFLEGQHINVFAQLHPIACSQHERS